MIKSRIPLEAVVLNDGGKEHRTQGKVDDKKLEGKTHVSYSLSQTNHCLERDAILYVAW